MRLFDINAITCYHYSGNDSWRLLMASFSVRKLDERVYRNLRIQAAKHGVSMEEEVRRIITRAVGIPDQISHVFQKYFGLKNGVDLEE